MFAIRQRHEELAEKNEALGNLREENTRLRAEAERARAIADSQAARANAAEDECSRAIESLAITIAAERVLKSGLLASIEAANTEAAQHAAKHEALRSVLAQIGQLAAPSEAVPAAQIAPWLAPATDAPAMDRDPGAPVVTRDDLAQ